MHIEGEAHKVLASVVIPFTKVDDYLASAIASVLGQTYTDWELLLAGDGVDEAALRILQDVKDPRIAVVNSPERTGLAKRLNLAHRLVQGDFTFRMDSDDIMHPLRLAQTIRSLNSGEWDVVGSRAFMIDEMSRVRGLFREPKEVPATAAAFLRSNALSHPTVAARTNWFHENPYDERLPRAEDKELWLRTAPHSSFYKLPEPLMFYRVIRERRWSIETASHECDREVMRQYAHLASNRITAERMQLTSHVRQAVQQISRAFPLLGSWLYSRKAEPIGENREREAVQILGKIDSIKKASPALLRMGKRIGS